MAKIHLHRMEELVKTHNNSLNRMTPPSFDFSFNKLGFTLIYSASKHELFFLKVGTQETLSLEVRDFQIDNYFPKNKYYEVRDFFEIKNDSNSTEYFKPVHLIEAIDSRTTLRVKPSSVARKVYNKKNSVEEDNYIYFYTIINWELLGNKKHYSQKNRAKVKLYFPELYHRIKDLNITVKFTDDELYSTNESEEIIKKIKTLE